jgi:hypothetical protein
MRMKEAKSMDLMGLEAKKEMAKTKAKSSRGHHSSWSSGDSCKG